MQIGVLAAATPAAWGCGGEPAVPPTGDVASTAPQPAAVTRDFQIAEFGEAESTGLSVVRQEEPLVENDGSSDADASGETPLPEGVSPGLVRDAQMYADQFGVDLQEAITRLMLQEPAGELGAALEAHEGGALSGFWIKHEPEFGVVAAFTGDGEETIRKYVQGGPLEELVEVRQSDVTLRDLRKAQSAATGMLSKLEFQVASSINVFENRVELYAENPAELAEALRDYGMTLPDHVKIIGQ